MYDKNVEDLSPIFYEKIEVIICVMQSNLNNNELSRLA